MNRQVKDILEGIIGEIKSMVPLAEQGCTSKVQKITTENNNFLLKTSFRKKYREWLKKESEVLQKLNEQTQVPVPKYYGFFETEEHSHVIMSLEPGVTLTSALKQARNLKEKKSLMKSFGDLLRRLHETAPIDSLKTPNDWLDNQLVKAKRYLEMGEADGDEQLLKKLIHERPQPVQQTIIHGDCTPDNVMVVDGEVKLFIDVAGMTIGDPRYDASLAIGYFIDDEELKNSFYEGYTRYKVSKEEYTYFNEGLYEFF